ncbi:hypothetical protein U472_15360 [Orenia metallireducens]|uniref:Uncharacterized protein n=1 Tax=Orenia metallireducens TaxID=1413210 RepID=A0A1C0A6D5_9FIRM|nr:hypothetical protein [Orenia metallireducens]OCL25704.1 hypothetical protein U472_15360 [Orenia metallireducens]
MNTIQKCGVNYNTNLFNNKSIDKATNNRRKKSSEIHVSTETFVKLAHKLGYTDYSVSTGKPISNATAFSDAALFRADRRKKFNNRFDDILEKIILIYHLMKI